MPPNFNVEKFKKSLLSAGDSAHDVYLGVMEPVHVVCDSAQCVRVYVHVQLGGDAFIPHLWSQTGKRALNDKKSSTLKIVLDSESEHIPPLLLSAMGARWGSVDGGTATKQAMRLWFGKPAGGAKALDFEIARMNFKPKIRIAPNNALRQATASRHAAWGQDLSQVSESSRRLGERALRQSGGDWRRAEELFEGYLQRVRTGFAELIAVMVS